MHTRKKLIEVALPLEKINAASAREKSIRHGHPSTLHLWWARRPLAAARAVIFAQMVDDPSVHPERFPTEEAQAAERERLFGLIEEMVRWENTTNEEVLNRARKEIWQSWRNTCADHHDHPRAADLFNPERLPAFHDPFAGGGSLPLEAQRLGLESYASDLNSVAVLINKAMIEIPPRFAGQPPVSLTAHHFTAESTEERRGKGNKLSPQRTSASSAVDPACTAESAENAESTAERRTQQPMSLRSSASSAVDSLWPGATGLAADVRSYGQWMRDEAEKRIGHLYPKVEITAEMARERPDLKPYVGKQLTVIAWLWARTVRSPNPAFAHVEVPLISTFMLSTKAGKEVSIEPVVEGDGYHFTVKVGKPKDLAAAKSGTKLSRGANFQCIMSGTPITPDYIKAEGMNGRMGARMMAMVAEGERGRVYLAPTREHEAIAEQAQPEWEPETEIPPDRRSMFTPLYGLTHFRHLFTPRQLVALTTFADLVQEAREQVKADAIAAFTAEDTEGRREHQSNPQRTSAPSAVDHTLSLNGGGSGAAAYADAVMMYLAFSISKLADRGSTICTWFTDRDSTRNTFARQSLPMTWDYAELNTLLNGTGSFAGAVNWTAESIEGVAAGHGSSFGESSQSDASTQSLSTDKLISTDPPYYDNVPYADLSDFFYVWLRCSLRPIFADLFATLAVPKAEELVATPYRHGSKQQAEQFFLDGMTNAMQRLAEQAHPAFPVTIYYAFKQAERSDTDGISSTGWETFLDAVIRAGFAITGTWPMRTELSNRMIGSGHNALASSIVLVCRTRPSDAPTVTRRDFLAALKEELPGALRLLQLGNIAPVDLAQAAIGPGMAVYTRYARVLDTTGTPLSVREALILINQSLDEVLAEQEGDFDSDTRWALAWFEQYKV